MRVLGLIVEYNPFHYGHLYHLTESQRLCQPDLTIALMSGNFTQRGEPAIVDKWARAEMAVLNGVDAVFELPVAWAVRSARDFAFGGVWHLAQAGVTHLCFGSESGELDTLQSVAEILASESPEYQAALRYELEQGVTYPRARYQALHKLGIDAAELLREPNNILGVSYLLALNQMQSTVIPFTIARKGANYHDPNLTSPLASATAIRKAIASKTPIDTLPAPQATNSILSREIDLGKGPLELESFVRLIKYAIRQQDIDQLQKLPDMEPGLAYRLKECEERTSSIAELISCVKTKRYTWTRIQRILCYALLGLTNETLKSTHQKGPSYLRLLACRKSATSKLKLLPTSLPIVNRPAKFSSNLSLTLDSLATNAYTLGFPKLLYGEAQQDLTRPPVIVE